MAWDRPGLDIRHAELAERWAVALGAGTRDHVMPRSSETIRELLRELIVRLDGCVLSGSRVVATTVGADLAAAHLAGDVPGDRDIPDHAQLGCAQLGDSRLRENDILGHSIDTLARHFARTAISPDRSALVLGAFASGYLRAFRSRLLTEQESSRAADIAAHHQAEQRLRDSEARLRAAFSQAGIGAALADTSGRIIEANAAFAAIHGYRPEQIQALDVTDLTHPDDPPGIRELYAGVLHGDRDRVQWEKAHRHRDGHTVWTDINVSLIRDAQGRPQFTLILVEDISERRALRERLEHRADRDPLTGLLNRARLIDTLATAFDDRQARIGLCYIGLDHFKTVNDSLGHDAGDELLIAAATRLRQCASRPDQLVARMGGDEFAVLVAHSHDAGESVALARAVVSEFSVPFDIRGHRLTVTASVGVIDDRSAHSTASELLQAADSTMYWAKAAGRARYAVFDPDRRRREHARAELTAALPGGLARGEFFLDYQPIVSLTDHTPSAVEALVRWQHPELGLLNPGRFVELAENDGHIAALGEVVLDQACRQARDWFDRFGGCTPVISVNVSAAEVGDPVWLQRVQHTIADTGIATDQLQLELTERTFMHATGRPLEALRTLADAGVRIAIDDFGTGYSNLAYLGRLPLHVVKLAGPFIQRIRDSDQADRADLVVLETIIDLSHALGLTVTAECVETGHQADLLLDLGCDTAQGWHFHRPMPAATMTDLLSGLAEETTHPGH